jgi:hypothetical protein
MASMIWIFRSIGSALTSSAVMDQRYRRPGRRASFFSASNGAHGRTASTDGYGEGSRQTAFPGRGGQPARLRPLRRSQGSPCHLNRFLTVCSGLCLF